MLEMLFGRVWAVHARSLRGWQRSSGPWPAQSVFRATQFDLAGELGMPSRAVVVSHPESIE